ncbi:D-2-hydroxyacid dehydrogenase [Clostridium sp. HCP1S3_B4]|uniref:D-2-hydroxyacid dehydrogenase n=1 Tax=unclassified Clostridium TaxID=2614128 RepID=UPI003F88CF84|nr:D-2-hydroxyacid dehydrogenase [Clostridiales bacterium]
MKEIVILETGTLGNLKYNLLDKFGSVTYYENTKRSETKERIKNANIIITNKVVLDEEVLKDAKNVELICEAATGYNNIDIEYAKKRNIAVTNVAGYSTQTVAQHTFALLLHLYDEISYFDNYVKSMDYSRSGNFTNITRPYNDIDGKVWGIVGLGAIGKKVAQIAEAFGAKVIYYSTSGKNNNDKYKRVSLDELLEKSDIISIHAPLNGNTQGLFNYDNLCKMKKSSVLINVGRGPIVVDEDLAKAIDNNIIKGAALDVFTVEPLSEENPLLKVKNKNKLVLTPHVAWASVEARERLFNDLVDNIKCFYNGQSKNRIC